MCDTQPGPDKARFLIHAATEEPGSAPLSEFLAIAATDPEIAVVDTIGPRERPHTAVVELSAEKASKLAQRFRSTTTILNQLTIEPDRPLSLFDSAPVHP